MGISIWQLLIVLVIVLLLFGTRKLRNLGSDLGGAIKSFKNALSEGEEQSKPEPPQQLDEESPSVMKETDADFKSEKPERKPL
ncbi:MAG: hypothetical protein AXA67_05175 [Methylothermaceae bacteria B42]|nr:MAG: hypothetical protein AXA67_05175 [Methylothermaceae bacteria B42]HHJ39360.1 twin-arginine translocase TatA/TatE family subunit [Methylothermaceae bacterium]